MDTIEYIDGRGHSIVDAENEWEFNNAAAAAHDLYYRKFGEDVPFQEDYTEEQEQIALNKYINEAPSGNIYSQLFKNGISDIHFEIAKIVEDFFYPPHNAPDNHKQLTIARIEGIWTAIKEYMDILRTC